MKKMALTLLLAAVGSAHAAWQAVWYVKDGGTIYLENASVQRMNGFLRATTFTDYTGAINSDIVCYPAAGDCQWKKLNTTVTYDWGCNNAARLVYEKTEWDSGPSSESFSRDTYTAPDPRPLVTAPGPIAVGGTYNISNDQPLLAVQAVVCQYR